MMQGMVINMEEARLQTLAQVKAFLDGPAEVAYRVSKAERHRFVERVFKRSARGEIYRALIYSCIRRWAR
jgi:hypothetical protein